MLIIPLDEMDIRWDIKNNQAVLLPAFWRLIQVVTRQVSLGFSEFPIPNWAVKYSGLMRYGLFKRNLKGSLCNIIIGLLTSQSISI
jgi:hypothetical protein